MNTPTPTFEATAEELLRDLAELKAEVRGIRTTDFWLLFGALTTVCLGLVVLLAHGFGWV